MQRLHDAGVILPGCTEDRQSTFRLPKPLVYGSPGQPRRQVSRPVGQAAVNRLKGAGGIAPRPRASRGPDPFERARHR